MNNLKCDKSCENCMFICCNRGRKLIPITNEELEEMGYIICDDFTTKIEPDNK